VEDEHQTNNPSSDGVDGHIFVMVSHSCFNLGTGRVLKLFDGENIVVKIQAGGDL